MDNLANTKSPFYIFKKYKAYKNIFFSFFIFFVIPFLILKSIINNQFYSQTIYYIFSSFFYVITFLFINSFVILYGLSRGKKFSFTQVIKFIPSIITIIIIPISLFTITLVFVKSFFLIAPFLLLMFIPIVSFAPLFNKSITLLKIFSHNQSFLKTTAGKTLLKNIFILSFMLIAIIFIQRSVMFGSLSYFANDFIYSIYIIFYDFLFVTSIFILYLTIVSTYSVYSFIISDNINEKANKIIAQTKNTKRKRRDLSSKKHSHNKKSYKGNIFDFEKEDKKKKPKQKNRFTDDEGFNRFEDTKF